MKLRYGYESSLVGVWVLSLFLSYLSPAQTAVGDMGATEGFENLEWGASIAQALHVYPDLYFHGYILTREKETPSRIYYRKNDTDKIYGVPFDSVEYWFKDDRFYRIVAVLDSNIGPRTLMTQAERSYDTLMDLMKRRYGKPKEYKVSYVTEYLAVVKEAKWRIRDVSIFLKYNGAAKGDSDRLILTMGKQGGTS